jgi:hypothetical protein
MRVQWRTFIIWSQRASRDGTEAKSGRERPRPEAAQRRSVSERCFRGARDSAHWVTNERR